MDNVAETVRHDIEQFGCSVIFVGDEEPPLAYTVGLWLKHQHPELIMFGLSGRVMHSILMYIAKMVASGRRFTSAERLAGVGGEFGVEVVPVNKAHLSRYCGFGLGFYEEEFPLAQVVWPDNKGRFPTEPRYSKAYAKLQPTLKRGA